MRVRVRWWWFVLAFVAILIVSVPVGLSVLRKHNLAAYEADGKVLADLGYVMSWDEVEFPVMDAEVQARWKAWGKGVAMVHGPLESWWHKPTLPAPEGAEKLLDEQRHKFGVGLECLRAGVVPGMIAELARHLSVSPSPTYFEGDSILVIRALASFCRVRALLDPDPSQALADLDRLDKALRHPFSVIDLMVISASAEIRDDAWLEIIRTMRMTRVQAQSWLNNDGAWLERSRSAWMGERLSFPIWMSLDDQPQNPFAPTTWYSSAIMPAEMNHYRHNLTILEASLGAVPPPPPPKGILLHKPIISGIAIPNLRESLHTLAERATTGRIKRLAGRLYLDHHDGKPWPADEAELLNRYGSDILDATDTSSALTYRLGRDGVPLLSSDPGKPPRILPPPHRSSSLTLTEP